MGEVEARKLGDAHSLSENKFYIYRRNKGLSVVSEETLKRINKEIPINSKYLKQGIAVMGHYLLNIIQTLKTMFT